MLIMPIQILIDIKDVYKRQAPICKQYGVEMNGVFYTFDNQWQKEHHLSVLVVRLVVSVVVWLVLSIGMVLLGNALFLKKEAQ